MTTAAAQPPERIVAAINALAAASGEQSWKVIGHLGGLGTPDGVWRVERADGSPVVVKCLRDDGEWNERLVVADHVAEILVARAVPVSQTLSRVDQPNGDIALAQDFLEGETALVHGIDSALIEEVLNCIERTAGAAEHMRQPLPHRDWSVWQDAVIFDEQDNWWQLAATRPNTGHLLETLRELISVRTPRRPSNDLVHGDFNLGNVLVNNTGKVTGVVDADSYAPGCRSIDVGRSLTSVGGLFGPISETRIELANDIAHRIAQQFGSDALRRVITYEAVAVLSFRVRHDTPGDDVPLIEHTLRMVDILSRISPP